MARFTVEFSDMDLEEKSAAEWGEKYSLKVVGEETVAGGSRVTFDGDKWDCKRFMRMYYGQFAHMFYMGIRHGGY